MELRALLDHVRHNDRQAQATYYEHEHRERKGFQFFALVCGIVIYAMFGLLDVAVGGVEVSALLKVRFGFALPMLIILTALFVEAKTADRARLIMSIYMLVAGGSIALMIALTNGPVQFSYPIGVMVVICFGAGFCGQDLQQGLAVNTILVIWTGVAMYIGDTSTWVMVSSLAFLASAVLTMAVASVTNDVLAKARFEALQKAQEATSSAVTLYHQAQESNYFKGQFLATVSHELRTPLNAIVGFAETMEMEIFGPIGDERYKGYVGDIKRSGQHLAHLIEDIIDFSKAETGEMRVDFEEYPVLEPVTSAITMCEGLRERRQQQVIFDGGPLDAQLFHDGDETRMRQAVVNVLVNAIKFTPPGGTIRVSVGQATEGGYIEIADNGPGISCEDLDRIRQPFKRVHDAYKADSQGLGLGLSIVDKIMEIHEGRLDIESALGDGCRVRLWLPPERVRVKAQDVPLTQVS